MLVSIPNSPSDRLKASLSQLLQLGGIALAFAIAIYLQLPQLAVVKDRSKTLSKATLQQEEAKLTTRLTFAKKMPTFGYRNLVADWHFLEFMQYFGDEQVRKQSGYGAAMEYFEAMLDRDPRFLFAYFYLSSTGTLYVGDPARSIAIMNRGLKSLTPKVPERGFYIWRHKGADELVFLGDTKASRQSLLTAADWARKSGHPEAKNVINIATITVKYLDRNPNSKQARFAAWSLVLANAVDKKGIERAIAEIKSLGGNVTIAPTGEFQIQPPPKD